MTRTLPPLNALRAFEAAARHGSFLGAARELGVTPPAVSQQVKALEGYWGRRLFERRNNAIVLTDAGRAAYPAVAEGFEKIRSVNRIAETARVKTRLVISALPSVALAWLGPLLADYAHANPGFSFALRVEEEPVSFARHEIDLRLCYDSQLYPDLVVEPLLVDRVMPLCAPDWLAARPHLTSLAELEDRDLIHIDWGPAFASLPSWGDCFEAAGIERDSGSGRREGQLVSFSSLAVDFAVAGIGMALGQALLARRALAAGQLVNPFGPALPLPSPYCLVYPHARARRPDLQALIAWLKRRAVP